MSRSNNNTTAFLDAVTNPFGAADTAQVPDRYSGSSICLTDWIDATTTVGGALVTDMSGIVITFLPCYSTLKNSYSSLQNVTYQLVMFPLTNLGGLISLTAASKITAILYQNYSAICGNTTDVDLDECLADSLRIFSAGIRVWSLTEVVTDTSIVHVKSFTGGQITPNTIYRSIVDGTNFRNIIKQTDHVKEFQGYEGCTVRYNPFNTDYQLDMLSLNNLNQTAHDYTQIMVPFIHWEFSAAQQSTASALVHIQSRVWLEGQLSLPTPIYSNASPIDLNFANISQIMSRPTERFPVCVAGHSFMAFTAGLVTVAGLLQTAANGIVAMERSYRNGGMNNRKRKSKPKNKKNKRRVAKVYKPRQLIRYPKNSLPKNIKNTR